jgi:hypothetical protein
VEPAWALLRERAVLSHGAEIASVLGVEIRLDGSLRRGLPVPSRTAGARPAIHAVVGTTGCREKVAYSSSFMA